MSGFAGKTTRRVINKGGGPLVSYLSTSALVRCIADIEGQVMNIPRSSLTDRQRVLLGVRDDCIAEMRSRQLAMDADWDV